MRVLLMFIWLLPFSAVGQHLERQVIGSAAVTGTGSFYYSSTAGQPAYTTGSGDGVAITQGFEQPRAEELTLEFDLLYSACVEGATLQVSAIEGCGDDIQEIQLNDEIYDPQAGPIEEGSYTVTFISNGGCSFSASFEVSEEDYVACEIQFYNLVTPNEDGSNDFWIIDNLGTDYLSNEVKILNRWGVEVWSGTNYDNDAVKWSGNDNSDHPLSSGTYFYSFSSEGFSKEGFIELAR